MLSVYLCKLENCVMNRKMIVIEGLDGSGKSTQVELLKSKLQDNNIEQLFERTRIGVVYGFIKFTKPE